jgi:ribose transport system substrate-binding protein
MKVVYYVPDTINPFWQQIIEGAQNQASKHSIRIEIISAQHDESRQIEQLKSYDQENCDGILLSPAGMTSIAPVCRNILDAGKPIVAIDQHMSGDVTASVMSANLRGGIMAGKYIADKLNNHGDIVHIQAEQHLQNASMRRKSFINEIDRLGLQIVKTIEAESSQDLAYEKTMASLEEGLRFDGLFAENDAMALGAVKALSRSNYSPWPIVVGYDGVEEALNAIRADKMDATIAQQPQIMGEKAVDIMSDILRRQSYDDLTIVPIKLITKEKLGDETIK